MYPMDTKFLVVDDMVAIRELVKGHLRQMGYKNVVEAGDGQQGFHALERDLSEDPVQFVISDWNMPKMTGLDFLKKVRATDAFKNLPFVLLTSESERDQVTEAVLAGASQYILKPFSPKVIEEKLRSVWEKGRQR